MEFIFMLTQHDVTVPIALEVFEEVRDTSLRHVGCKDIGLDLDQYAELFNSTRRCGIASYLEVVTYDEKKHFRAVDLALKIGADNLIGGMPQYTKRTLEYLRARGSSVKFFPYVGEIVDHPCILRGAVDQIIRQGEEAESLGVDGLNLLLYRYVGSQKALLKEVTEKLQVPVIVAGNVGTFEQIEELKNNNIWGFTIGGAIFEKKFVKYGTTRDQIAAVLSKL